MFNVNDAISAVRTGVDERVDNLHAQIAKERDEAMEAALAYARSLAAGGDPDDHPDTGSRWNTPSRLLSIGESLTAVYVLWNMERGGTNEVSPINNQGAWLIAEYMHERLGEAVKLEDLRKVGRTTWPATPNEVARSIKQAATSKVLAEKGKLDGKVAYRLRLREPGEQVADDQRDRIRENAFDEATVVA